MRDQATISAAAAVEGWAVLLRWEIAPEAVRRTLLGAVAAMNGRAERITRAVLEWAIDEHEARATLRLEVGEEDVAVPLMTAAGGWVEEGGFVHGEFGAVRVSVRDGVLAWARTEVLSGMLGLGGGVYEGPEGTIRTIAPTAARYAGACALPAPAR